MKILFFSLHQGIWNHAFPEALIASALCHKNHEVTYVGCESLLENYCTVMSAFGIDYSSKDKVQEKTKTCSTCIKCNSMLINKYGFDYVKLSSFLSSDDFKKIDNVMQSINKNNIFDFVVEDIHLGRISLYQYLLEKKINKIDFSDIHEWHRAQVEVKNTLTVLFAAKNLLQKLKPDRVVLYNPLYSVNHVVSILCNRLNINQYFLHAGLSYFNKYETLIVGQKNGFIYYENLLNKWLSHCEEPLIKTEVDFVYKHLKSCISGDSIFSYSSGLDSKNFDLKHYFKIGPHQKIILATMSSNDERQASELIGMTKEIDDQLFSSQIVWLEELISYFKNNPKLFLIIRVHPREFSNKRDNVISENYLKLEKMFENLPDNVRANLPNEKISLYHLISNVDLCLNAWSSAGKEAAALGKCVITYSKKHLVHPHNLCIVPASKEEYFQEIENEENYKFSLDRAKLGFRWLAFECLRTVIHFNDKEYNFIENTKKHILTKVFNKIDKNFYKKQSLSKSYLSEKNIDLINHIIETNNDSFCAVEMQGLEEQKNRNASIEHRAIKEALDKLYDFINQKFVTSKIPIKES
jgi:hypothetical protein